MDQDLLIPLMRCLLGHEPRPMQLAADAGELIALFHAPREPGLLADLDIATLHPRTHYVYAVLLCNAQSFPDWFLRAASQLPNGTYRYKCQKTAPEDVDQDDKCWGEFSRLIRDFAYPGCEACSARSQCVHHVTNAHRGSELVHCEDVRSLCFRCHDLAHEALAAFGPALTYPELTRRLVGRELAHPPQQRLLKAVNQ